MQQSAHSARLKMTGKLEKCLITLPSDAVVQRPREAGGAGWQEPKEGEEGEMHSPAPRLLVAQRLEAALQRRTWGSWLTASWTWVMSTESQQHPSLPLEEPWQQVSASKEMILPFHLAHLECLGRGSPVQETWRSKPCFTSPCLRWALDQTISKGAFQPQPSCASVGFVFHL